MRVLKPDNPALSQKSRLTIGVSFASAPAGTVDITISGAYIDTINKTLSVQECTDGYAFSFFANAATSGFAPFDITVAGVGYDSVVFEAYLSEDTEETNSKWTPLLTVLDGVCNWLRELPTFTDVATKRQSLANDIFIDVEGVYPTGAPDSINTGGSGANGITFDNVASSTKVELVFTENDSQGYEWESVVGWSVNSTPSNVLVIDHLGHGEDGHDLMYDAIMDAGYDYANFALPLNNSNPNITSSFPTDVHNDMVDVLETPTYDIRRLFLFDKIRGLDYILSQKTYTKVVLVGISGGGQMALLLGSLYPSIDIVMAFRGTGAQGQPYGGNEAEQGPKTLDDYFNEGNCGAVISASMRRNTRLDMMALCAANGRKFHLVNHLTDDCCWKGYYPDIIKKPVEDKAAELGGNFYVHHFTDSGTAHHAYHTVDDVAYAMANI